MSRTPAKCLSYPDVVGRGEGDDFAVLLDRLVNIVARGGVAGGSVGVSHLERAAAALAVSAAAERLARVEVMAARSGDRVSWQDVGDALGVSRQTAHERFRTGPDGMHSRLFKTRGKTSGG